MASSIANCSKYDYNYLFINFLKTQNNEYKRFYPKNRQPVFCVAQNACRLPDNENHSAQNTRRQMKILVLAGKSPQNASPVKLVAFVKDTQNKPFVNVQLDCFALLAMTQWSRKTAAVIAPPVIARRSSKQSRKRNHHLRILNSSGPAHLVHTGGGAPCGNTMFSRHSTNRKVLDPSNPVI
jgi:hypothetical protein